MARTYYLNCRETGLDCDFEARGENLDQVVELCAEHGARNHGMKGFGPELFARIRLQIKVQEA